MYHHKSGAQKRKERAAREQSTVTRQRTLQSVGFTSRVSATSSNCNQPSDDCDQAGEAAATSTDVHLEAGNSDCLPELACSVIEDDLVTCPTASKGHKDEGPEEETLLTETTSTRPCNDFDVGLLETETTSAYHIEEAIRRGPSNLPACFPDDSSGRSFPVSLLQIKLKNGETVRRDWLVWSKGKQALFCFPCRLLSSQVTASRSSLASPYGFTTAQKWRKLHEKVPEHENSISHKNCYIQWRQLEKNLRCDTGVDNLLIQSIKSKTEQWKLILRRIIDVVLFLGERGLAFRGTSHLIGDPSNGNFLGLLELIGHYDPVLADHLNKVRNSQIDRERLQVHYLSSDSQNEFIKCCASKVTRAILKELEAAKYYSIIVDATPDSAHVEQTVFILCYVHLNVCTNKYEVQERFLEFVNCNKKTGEAIAELIRHTLRKHHISLSDCRGQGFDNGSNMAGAYKGVQALILKDNPLAMYSPCACHSLNLCGVHAAECCQEVITFFGAVQKLYTLFSSSPQRWEILTETIGCSLHNLANTRWSARLDSVKPFVAHLSRLKKALELVEELNLTAETRADVHGIHTYLNSFECILMSSIWFKVLTLINFRSTVLQAREATLDAEVENIKGLIEDLTCLRNKWESILVESKNVAVSCDVAASFDTDERKRKRKKLCPDGTTVNTEDTCTPEDHFKRNVFYRVVDCVIGNMTSRYDAAKNLETMFGVIWKYPKMSDEEMCKSASILAKKYSVDVSGENLISELEHLKAIHNANLGDSSLTPLELLNKLHHLKIDTLFTNITVILRIFCTLPVTVAQAERSFSILARVKNVLRSTMCQDRLSSLGVLAVESRLARTIDFDCIIELFASRKARKAPLV